MRVLLRRLKAENWQFRQAEWRIDKDGVGELIKIAITKIRAKTSNIKLGVCGEHGGDEESIEFFYDMGFDYVSCSPYRVPVARLKASKI